MSSAYSDEEDDDFQVEEEEVGADGDVDGMACSPSPMLDDSIMSHNATLALDSRTSPPAPNLPCPFNLTCADSRYRQR